MQPSSRQAIGNWRERNERGIIPILYKVYFIQQTIRFIFNKNSLIE